MHSKTNFGMVLEFEFIIIVIIVLYCINPLEKNDILIACYIATGVLAIIAKYANNMQMTH